MEGSVRAHEALSRTYALSGFLVVVNRLFEDGVFVGHMDEDGEEREVEEIESDMEGE
jgi:hypothetical protein